MPKNTKPGKWEDLGVHVLSELERLNRGQEDLTTEMKALTSEMVRIETNRNSMGTSLKDAIERIDANYAESVKTLKENTALLGEHIRRTEAAEASLKVLQDEMSPIRTTQAAIKLSLKVAAGISTLVGLAVGLFKLWSFLIHG